MSRPASAAETGTRTVTIAGAADQTTAPLLLHVGVLFTAVQPALELEDCPARELDFGEVAVGSRLIKKVLVKNVSGVPLSVRIFCLYGVVRI